MNCRDFLRQRSTFGHAASVHLPPEMREHLAECPDCARLEEYLAGDQAEVPDLQALESKVYSSIQADLRPVTPLPSSGVRTLGLIGGACLVTALIVFLIHPYGWIAMTSIQSLGVSAVLGALIFVSARSVSAQMVPGERRWLSPRSLLLLCVLPMPVVSLLLFPSVPDDQFGFHAIRCWRIGTLSGALAVPIFWFVLRRGFPLAPVSHLTCAGALAGLTGIAILELHCPLMDDWHKVLGHGTVAITAALMGAASGSLRYRRVCSLPTPRV